MPSPLPASNPLYPRSLFPNGVDTVNDLATPAVSDAIGAIQSTLLGTGSSLPSISTPGPVTPGNGTVAGGPAIYGGTGAPVGSTGAIGDFYFRKDTPGTANQRIYVKTGASAWTGIV